MNRHHENTDENAYTRQDEEALYEIAAAEIAVRRVKKGLWAKAYAQCEGDPNRTKALYIKLRVQALKDEAAHNARQAAPAAEECAQAENALVVQGNSEEPFQYAPWGQIFDGEMHEKKLDASDTGAKSVAADRSPETTAPVGQGNTCLGDNAHPWRRFFARLVDYSTPILLLFVLFYFAFYTAMPEQAAGFEKVVENLKKVVENLIKVEENHVVAMIILCLLWLPVEALFLSWIGTTPAKWLFGIRVAHPDGTLLSFSEAFRRSFRVSVQGVGLGIPFIALFTQLLAYQRLTKTGTTRWDTATNAVVSHKEWGVFRALVCTVSVFFAIGLPSSLGALLGQISLLQNVQQNYEKALSGDAQARQALEQAAALGDAGAQFGLGAMYYDGQGVPQDYAQARQWWEKAAAQGFAGAQYGLGVLYANGQGVPQDYAQARQWYEKAAAQGSADAQNGLGVLYANGQGVPQDYAQARHWWEKAAAQGDAAAQFNLGLMYYNGQGVRQDKRAAKAWYDKACEAGDQGGCDKYRELSAAGF